MNQKLICPSHHNLIQIVCLNEYCQSFRFSCYECLSKEHHLSHIRDVKKVSDFLDYKLQRQKEDQEFVSQFQHYLDQIIDVFNQIRNKLLLLYQTKIDTLDEMNELLNLFLQQHQEKFDSIILKVQQELLSVLKSYSDNLNQISINSFQSNLGNKNIKYQLIQTIKESPIYSFSFNSTSSMLAAGYSTGQIAIFELGTEQIRKQQILKEHKGSVYSIEFFYQKDCFISGGQDRVILIWSFENKLWICQQRIDAHSDWVSHLIINKNNTLIISSSGDKTIQFWNKGDLWKRSQTITAHLNTVNSLSLNDAEDQLISCSCDHTIKIFESKNSNWIILQTIKVDKLGFRLCFINNFTFVFQSENSINLSVYKFSQSDGLYQHIKNVLIENGNYCGNLFPSKYIRSKNIILNKNGNKVNLIKIPSDEEFILEEVIDFGTRAIFGNISYDGQYIATWDKNTKQIQIRKYVE
ncbi:unnamed protein product [Paramecium octaurelia]|uniref:Uncharacterized protein n=1 Tax=Paramecium octaurelia TaxID=43137 RepID=A0A8S1XZ25_PAROT|nr:unnamed protein product [Paramecium octaurelia]